MCSGSNILSENLVVRNLFLVSKKMRKTSFSEWKEKRKEKNQRKKRENRRKGKK